ncbi:MAG: hypothetical protein ABSE63_09525 [Thermoguttaceae bacterium]|jgi:hypothetical protein
MTNVNVEIGDMGSVLAMAERARKERGNQETVAAILAWVLSEGRIEHRLRAAGLLAALGSSAAPALPAILTCLAGAEELPTLSADEREFCLLCVEALERIGPRAQEATSVLVGWLRLDDPEAALAAACAIARIDKSLDELVLPILMPASQAVSEWVSSKAFMALRALGLSPGRAAPVAA